MTSRQRGWLLPLAAPALAGGILLGRIASSWVFGAAGMVLALSACLLLRGRGRFCACLALVLALGCVRGYFSYHPALPPEGTYQITGIVAEEVEQRANHQIRTVLREVALDGKPLSGGTYWSFYAEEIPGDLLPGRQVSFQGSLYHPSGPQNPDGYDFREEMLRRNIRTGVYGYNGLLITSPDGFSLSGWTASLRHRLTLALISSPLGEESGGYAAALLLGNRSLLPQSDRRAFSRLGIAHILSVSGFHVGVLVGMLALLFRLLRLPQGLRLGLYALLLGFYVLLCGSAQPVLRAALLLLLAQRGRMLARPRLLTHLLAAAMTGMLLLSPVQLTGLSFQLSFGAVLGLSLVTPFLRSLWSPVSRPACWLRDALATGLGAQIGILLPELYAFQELPLLSLALNIPIMVFAAGLIWLDWAALVSLAVPGLSPLICGAARLATEGLLRVVRLLGSLPGITLWTKAAGPVTALDVLLLGAGLCGLTRFRGRTRGMLCAGSLAILCLSLIPMPHAGTEYYQFSVGDADAALLWDGDFTLVLDAGYEDGVLSDFLHRRRLTPDAVLLTHLHSDHALGLQALREDHIPVPLIYLPEGAETGDVHPSVIQLLEELREEGTEIRYLSAGDSLPLPSGSLETLWPEKGRVRPGQDANEFSLTMLLRLKGTTMLQTGDLDGRYEMYAAAAADLLKAPHHGSARSSSEAFLRAVSPAAVLLSCADTDRALQYEARLPEGTDLYSTAARGMLTVRFSEGGFTVETFLPTADEPAPKEE